MKLTSKTSNMLEIKKPYLLFLGDAPDDLSAKTAKGILDWRPDDVVGQLSLSGCQVDLGVDELDLVSAWEKGARTLVVGAANRGGVISSEWHATLRQALEIGFDIASGLHNKVADIPEIGAIANQLGRQIFDVRHPSAELPIGNGEKRSGKRILPVGTDCSCGKMYTALALHRDMQSRGLNSSFRATGQTGILIEGSGISVDAVVADFIAGAVESISPANDSEHWDVIEGQGSLGHPSYSGVTLGLIHGSQPDAMVLCHEPTRTHMRGLPHQALPSISNIISMATELARVVNAKAKFVGMCINTSLMNSADVPTYLDQLEQQHGLPAVDPFTQGTARIIDLL